ALTVHGYGQHRPLRSCPTRRSSDLFGRIRLGVEDLHHGAPALGAAEPGAGGRPVAAGQRPHAAVVDGGVLEGEPEADAARRLGQDRKSTRLNSSHVKISYADFGWEK